MLIGATNWLEAIDEARLRPGRFDVREYVGPPGEQANRTIPVKSLEGRPLSPDVSLEGLVPRTADYSAADPAAVVQTTAQRVFPQAVKTDAKEIPLCWPDLQKALTTFVPSISPAEPERYEKTARTFQTGDDRPSDSGTN